MKTIPEIIKQAHENAVEKGFYDDGAKNIGELLMLVVSELGEALEAHRKDRRAVPDCFFVEGKNPYTDNYDKWEFDFKENIKDTFEDELADAVIRICDMCGYLGIDLEKHIELKMKYNATREYKHGKRY